MDNVKIHKIKFAGKQLCDAVYSGNKKYEIRKNDRDYSIGDIIIPISVSDDGSTEIHHPIDRCKYVITYISKEWPVALKEGYCVFSIKLLGKDYSIECDD